MLSRRFLLAATLALPAAAPPAAAAAAGSFQLFLADAGRKARAKGVPARVIAAAFRGLTPDPAVISRDHTQPEFTLTWPQYRARVLPPARLAAARQAFQANQSLLRSLGALYGVAPAVIVAIWGIESNFGANKGKFSLIRSLATLAWNRRRGSYFEAELVAALQILAAGYATQPMLISGWAGAMGQPQFMPSAYLADAVDFDGDGKRDIWNSVPDTLASIANYLRAHGWQRGQPWGERIAAAPHPLADGDSVLNPDGAPADEIYLLHGNFRVIKRYNPSDFYALAVGLLADAAV